MNGKISQIMSDNDRCSKYSRDLLLVTHGELAPIARLRLSWHLRKCAACRTESANWSQISGTIAEALRPADAPCWRPTRSLTGLGGTKIALLLTTFVLFTLFTLGFVGFRLANQTPDHSSKTISRSSPPKGCAPNLPSDRCR